MKTNLPTNLLVRALKLLARVVNNKSSLAILKYVRLEAWTGGLTVEASNLDHWLTFTLPADVERAGGCCVPLRHLRPAVAFGPRAQLEQTPGGKVRLRVDLPEGRVELEGRDVEEWPSPGVIDPKQQAVWRFQMLGSHLTGLLARLLPIVSTDETRYVLNGVRMEVEGDQLLMVATDGRQLRVVRTQRPPSLPDDWGIILPTPAIQLLLAIEPRGAIELTGTVDRFLAVGEAFATDVRWQLEGKLIDGVYPKWRMVVPNTISNDIHADRAELLHALEAVGAFECRKATGVHLQQEPTTDGSQLRLRRKLVDPDVEIIRRIKTDGPVWWEAERAFSVEFLKKIVATHNADTVALEQGDAMQPLRIETEDSTTVLMPMRVG